MPENPGHSERSEAPPPTTSLPAQGKLLALDVGLARIGIAVCDPLRLRARPISTLTRASRRDDFAQLAQIVQREEVVAVICGLPLNMDGTTGQQAQTTRKWALRLAQALRALLGHSLPVYLWDERLSSYSARQIAHEWPRSMGEDALAATVILQSLLDELRRSDSQSDNQSEGQSEMALEAAVPPTRGTSDSSS